MHAEQEVEKIRKPQQHVLKTERYLLHLKRQVEHRTSSEDEVAPDFPPGEEAADQAPRAVSTIADEGKQKHVQVHVEALDQEYELLVSNKLGVLSENA